MDANTIDKAFLLILKYLSTIKNLKKVRAYKNDNAKKKPKSKILYKYL